MACAWLRLASLAAAKRTPRKGNDQKNRIKQGSQKVSQNFLGRGDVTEQSGRVALASRRKAKFTATRKRGGAEPSPLNRLGIGCRFCRRAQLSFIGFMSAQCTS